MLNELTNQEKVNLTFRSTTDIRNVKKMTEMTDMMTRYSSSENTAPAQIQPTPIHFIQLYNECDEKLFIACTFTDDEWYKYFSPRLIVDLTERKGDPMRTI